MVLLLAAAAAIPVLLFLLAHLGEINRALRQFGS
jgi:hypothetical protein